MKKLNDTQQLLSRVITFLTREELDYIDKISKDSFFSTGTKLPRTKILEAIVDACMELGITGENVQSKKDLMNKIFDAVVKKALEEMNKKGAIK